jgi:hypothetical protein
LEGNDLAAVSLSGALRPGAFAWPATSDGTVIPAALTAAIFINARRLIPFCESTFDPFLDIRNSWLDEF